MRDFTVRANGLDIQVREINTNTSNEATNENILFLHYSGANIAMWDSVVPYFEDSYNLLLIDLRGHGKSSKPATGYHIEDMASDVIDVLDQLNVEKTHIIGSSMGAEVGLVIASRNPNSVLSLVCEGALYSEFGPYGIHNKTEAEFNSFVAKSLEEYSNRQDVIGTSVDDLMNKMRSLYEEDWNSDFHRIERYGAYELGKNEYICGMSKSILTEYMTHYYSNRYEDYYSKLTCPVLMLPHANPETDREVQILNDLCALTKNGRIHYIDDWQHAYGWLLSTRMASNVVLKFLKEYKK